MQKVYIPNSADEVCQVMQSYILKKKFNFSEAQIEYMAESMYLYFEGRAWAGIKFWPSVAQRWVLNTVTKFGQDIQSKQEPTIQGGETVRDKILKEQQKKTDNV